ncbi:hypothetical protein KCU88_g5098, partial [Aureobasidium melanogenum]
MTFTWSKSDVLRYSDAEILPPPSVILELTDTYFQCCHGQPYCYFVEESFRRRLQEDRLPRYLLRAVLAMAARFSQDSFFQGQQQDIIDVYSRSAWDEIYEKSFSEDDALDITVVQATNMLAVVDFTNGNHNLAWVKTGLSVRFAQSLRLTADPLPDLTPEQQEERILTFCDCFVRLPSDSTNTEVEPGSTSLTLQTLQDLSDNETAASLSLFSHTILMASALGRIERFSLQKSDSRGSYQLWHDRSEYSKIYSLLLNFETYSDVNLVPFSEALDRWYSTDGVIDQRRAGHFIFSAILYNMNQCLLHHPFLLRNHVKDYKRRVPTTFIKHALRRGLEHARLLTLALRVIQQKDLSLASFYA